METGTIKAGCTYESAKRTKVYVQDIIQEQVIYCRVGDVTRQRMSIGRFAGWVVRQVANV